jgi:hypothetical protein
MIEYLIWSPDRATFIATMEALTNPVTGTPLAEMVEGVLTPSAGVMIDEIGTVTKTPAVLNENGEEVTPAVIVDGHHVNMGAYGELAALLTFEMPTEGDVFERTRILELLGAMASQVSKKGEPTGLVGTSGVKLYDPSAVTVRTRVWA